MPSLLTAVFICGRCGDECDGVWQAPEDQDDQVPVAEQYCLCGNKQILAWPGYSFRTEAG